ncbi:MAG TPA: S1/P1 nuclease [Bryobacteraceae bacterium]|nr:S1/P1 nuclease [Bryobacteraceae bacterium]
MRRTIVTLWLLAPGQAWCWGDEGHQTVARIAAAHLTARARQAVANLLNRDASFAPTGAAPSGAGDALAEAMARAAIWPDHMSGGKGDTAPWHYIDIGLFEGPSHAEQRCPQGNCIVAKMKTYLVNLREHRPDGAWPESKELAFLMHFAGDIHQPLHCVTDADAGGNCVNVIGFDPMHNLHAVWDITLVNKLMAQDGPGMIAGMESRFRGKARRWQDYRTIDRIAAESFGVAKSQVYGKARPKLPVIPRFIDVQPRNCATEAPESLRDVKVDGPRSYGAASIGIVRAQLYKGGVRLAAMLNAIYGD